MSVTVHTNDPKSMTDDQLRATLDSVSYTFRCWTPRTWRGKPTKMIRSLEDRIAELREEMKRRAPSVTTTT